MASRLSKLISGHILVLTVLINLVFVSTVFAQNAGGCNPADAAAGLCSPQISGGLVPCGNPGQSACDFNFLISLIENVISFLLVLAAIVAAILFAYAGFQYIFAAGDPSKIKKAHQMFWTVGIGLVFMGAAWLIVAVIVNVLGAEGTAGRFLEGIR